MPAANDFSPATQAWLAIGRHLTIAGMRIFVHERGTGSAILLLHGFPTSSYDWRGAAERLAESHRVIAPDFPGFGLSDKPEAYSYSLFQQADVINGLAEQLSIERAHVVSHDMGTSVHCELLAREQRESLRWSITRSTFLNGSMLQWLAKITPFQELLATNATLPQAIELCNSSMEAMYVPALKAIMKRPDCVSEEDATVMNELLAYQEGHRRLPAISGYMRERYLHRDRWLGALANARPLQFIWADGDPIAHAEMGRELSRMCPQADYAELADLGHFLLMEDAARVVAEIDRFARA